MTVVRTLSCKPTMERMKRSIKLFDVARIELYLKRRQVLDKTLIVLTGGCFTTRNVEVFRPEVSIPDSPVISIE